MSLTQDIMVKISNIQGLSESLCLPTFGPCYLCPTVGNHKAEVNRIVKVAIENCPNIDLQKFKSLPLCHIKVPTASGEETLCLDDIERKYIDDFLDMYCDRLPSKDLNDSHMD